MAFDRRIGYVIGIDPDEVKSGGDPNKACYKRASVDNTFFNVPANEGIGKVRRYRRH